MLIGDEGEALDAPGNTIPGGVVTDVSFVGVSTQYLVRMPWGQELQVFEQNTGRRRLFRHGDEVELSWRPEYAFLLDHDQDAAAGVAAGECVRSAHERDRRAGRDAIGYLLLVPALLWLVLFFVDPVLLAGRDQPVRPDGSDFRGYDDDLRSGATTPTRSRTTGRSCCARS